MSPHAPNINQSDCGRKSERSVTLLDLNVWIPLWWLVRSSSYFNKVCTASAQGGSPISSCYVKSSIEMGLVGIDGAGDRSVLVNPLRHVRLQRTCIMLVVEYIVNKRITPVNL